MTVQTLDIVQEQLKALHDTQGLSWRKIADLPEYAGIPAGTLCAISKGRDPQKPEHRKILKLPPLVTVKLVRTADGTFGSRKK